jgi:hypothetical protein
MKATLAQPLPIGAGPIGTRMYYDVTSGEITGDRLRLPTVREPSLATSTFIPTRALKLATSATPG